jgi:hypothetical protein
LGLHVVVFGVVPRNTALVERLSGHLRGFTMTVLLALFFVGVGLSTSVSLIGASVEHVTIAGQVRLACVVDAEERQAKEVGASYRTEWGYEIGDAIRVGPRAISHRRRWPRSGPEDRLSGSADLGDDCSVRPADLGHDNLHGQLGRAG